MKFDKNRENVLDINKDKTKRHPCYSEAAHQYMRMHIPIAPKCNVQCNYCNRKYDCQNESRPGVSSQVMSPKQALELFKRVKKDTDKLSVVGIAGPGDALANFEATKESIQLIKKEDPDVTFCLSTNGLELPRYMEELVELGVSHVTITINAVEPSIVEQIYSYIRYEGNRYTGREAATIIVENQLQGLRYLSDKGVLVKVNIVYIKGINDKHVDQVVETVKSEGAWMTNIVPLIPVESTPFENLPKASMAEMLLVRKRNERNITQMYHCKQCRADAIGKLGDECGCSAYMKEEIS